jgi:UrcA family protein
MNAKIRTTIYKGICCAYWAATVCALTAPARAAESDVPTKTVKFQDLDISKPAGAKALYRRIQAAAREVCTTDTLMDVHQLGSEQTCIQHAIDKAVKDVDSVALTNLRFASPVRLASK